VSGVYHEPDWSRVEKGRSLTEYAVCGVRPAGPDAFPLGSSVTTCPACLERLAAAVVVAA
jgi:hypothetical protein